MVSTLDDEAYNKPDGEDGDGKVYYHYDSLNLLPDLCWLSLMILVLLLLAAVFMPLQML